MSTTDSSTHVEGFDDERDTLPVPTLSGDHGASDDRGDAASGVGAHTTKAATGGESGAGDGAAGGCAGEETTDAVLDDDEVFPAKVVRALRKENARYRVRAGQADELARRLHAALVAADGRLADPSDLEFDEHHLEDPEVLEAAITRLVEQKPGLRARRLSGDIGAGLRGGDTPTGATDILSVIRGAL